MCHLHPTLSHSSNAFFWCRFVEEKMWVTFLEGYSALAALSLSGSTVSHYIQPIIVQDLSDGCMKCYRWNKSRAFRLK